MLNKLYEMLPTVLTAAKETDKWESLIINRRKPHTYRIFRMFGDLRVCLHRFHPCDEHEAFAHPHPWPAAFMVLQGGYKMHLGRSEDLVSRSKRVATVILKTWSAYEIDEIYTWHSVIPLETTYTVMVNGPEWEIKHQDCRTTKGKDLESMEPAEVERELTRFRRLLTNYQRYNPELAEPQERKELRAEIQELQREYREELSRVDTGLATPGLQEPDESTR